MLLACFSLDKEGCLAQVGGWIQDRFHITEHLLEYNNVTKNNTSNGGELSLLPLLSLSLLAMVLTKLKIMLIK